jgi:endonuclease YncB( thermonuclease family)
MRGRQSSKSNLGGRLLRTWAELVSLRPLQVILATAGLLISAHLARAADCPLGPQNGGPVASVTDGRTLVLGDGRTVRLSMIEVPPVAPSGAASPDQRTAGNLSRGALAELVGGKELLIAPFGTDRFGRVSARVYLSETPKPKAVEVALLTAGLAFVSPYAGNHNCAADLFAAERAARLGKIGFWGDAEFATRNADDPDAVLAVRGRFAIVEGKVQSVRESGGTIYVNFGRRWSEDFTVTIPKRNERLFSESGLVPKSLAGRRVRIRGVVEERGGPWIEAMSPGQIEIADR